MSEQQATYNAGQAVERYVLHDGTSVWVRGNRWYIIRHNGAFMLPERVVEELVAVWLKRDGRNGREATAESAADL